MDSVLDELNSWWLTHTGGCLKCRDYYDSAPQNTTGKSNRDFYLESHCHSARKVYYQWCEILKLRYAWRGEWK